MWFVHCLALVALYCISPVLSAAQSTLSANKVSLGSQSEDLIVSIGGLQSDQVRVFDLRTGTLKKTLNHPFWTAVNSRVVALDDHGHLWVGDDETNSLYEFDRNYRFIRTFPVDTSCIGPPPGSGVRSMAFSPSGELFCVGSWQSGTINYLFEVDPQTQQTVQCADLDGLAGSQFEPTRLTVGPDGLIYVSSWGAGNTSSARVAVVDPNSPGANTFAPVATLDPGGLELLSASVQVLPSESIVLGAMAAGATSSSIWLSDPGQSNWTQVLTCPSHGGFAEFTVGHGLVFTNGSPCDVGLGFIAVYSSTGLLQGSIDLNQGKSPVMQGFQGAVIRH